MKKNNSFSGTMMLITLLFFMIVVYLSVRIIDSTYSIKNDIGLLNRRIDIVENKKRQIGKNENNQIQAEDEIDDSKIIDYYRELSDKTDNAIDRIIAVVGTLGTILALLGAILAFKAPSDIENRMDELNLLVKKAKDSADEANYQAELIDSLLIDNFYDRRATDLDKIREISKLIAKYPDKPGGYFRRGTLYGNMGQKSSPNKEKYIRLAISDYEIAHKLGGNKSAYYNNMGVLYGRLKEYKKQIWYYTKAIEIDSDHATAHFNRSAIYQTLWREAESSEKKVEYLSLHLADLNKTIELDDQFAQAYYIRGATYSILWKEAESPEEKSKYLSWSLDDLNMAIELDAQNAKHYFSRSITYGMLWEEAEDPDKKEEYRSLCIADLNKVIELDPANEEAKELLDDLNKPINE